jgi:replicative DNA helicase
LDALNDLATEKALLGLLCQISASDVNEARGLIEKHGVETQHFASPVHQRVFHGANRLLSLGSPVEPVALSGLLGGEGELGLEGGVAKLLDTEGTDDLLPASFPAYAGRLRDLALRRSVAKELRLGLGKILGGDDAGIALAEISGSLARMTRTSKSYRTLNSVLMALADDMASVQAGEDAGAIPTGIEALDNVTGGLQRAVITIVAADTGVGKSAFLATIADQIASRGVKVGVFSLEDDAAWLAYRVLSQKAGVDQFKLRFRRKNEWELGNIEEGMTRLKTYGENLLIDDRPGLKPEELVITARDMVINRGVEAIIVDHIGELDLGAIGERHDLKIAYGLRQLRDVAKTHKIPLLLATQVTVRKEIERGSVPELRDFRNSREIANVSRVALGLGRKYGSDTMQIGILKNTNGPSGAVINVNFDGASALLDVK